MHKHAANLHTWTQDLRFQGLEIGTRMSVIDLDGRGTMLVHSPIRPTEEIRAQLNQLGNVAYVIAPNKWHHLYVKDFKMHYPQAKFFCAPGLQKKKPDFNFDQTINDEQNFPWNREVEHCLIKGAPLFNEIAFFHRQSKTLILTDTALHICENSPWLTRLFFRVIGTYRKFGLSLLEKLLFVKNPAAFHESMKKVSHWDFDRIIIAHGQVIETGGKAEFKRAYSV